ncbi:hypothetical protein SERLA73DRAFT_183230 [Serpula lacrymans var. lacrymans S7.3]|uniref:Secreted protein n=1 Tax=Serpula lacrymans var. lacrymans (strain S7.3) TaxID=936435 RepID=F8PZH7_SERL3|nr:hypothetical protein SERLA73DRAFT_183230 [Serpula lacrymans var. lacrymans S7.3]
MLFFSFLSLLSLTTKSGCFVHYSHQYRLPFSFLLNIIRHQIQQYDEFNNSLCIFATLTVCYCSTLPYRACVQVSCSAFRVYLPPPVRALYANSLALLS